MMKAMIRVQTVKRATILMAALLALPGAEYSCAAPVDAPQAQAAQNGFRAPVQSALIPSPRQAEEMRAHIENYLAQQAGAPIVLNEEMKNDERAYEDFWWSALRYTQAAEIVDDKKRAQSLHRLIGEHLQIAAPLLESRYIDERLIGIGLCVLAADCALDQLKDARLAQFIMEAEILPRLDDAHEEAWQFLSFDNLLSRIAKLYGGQSDKASREKLRLVYDLRLAYTTSRDDGDYLRLQMAVMAAGDGKTEAALALLKQISTPDFEAAARQLIADIEKKQASNQQPNK